MLFSSRKVEKSIKFLKNTGKFILYSLTFSQEIRVAGIAILDVISQEIMKVCIPVSTNIPI